MTDRPLTILLVVAHLAHRSGLSLYVQNLATELHRRGHRPIVYSSRNGAVAAQLRNSTIPVLDQLDAMGVAPDVIHGNNYSETLLALLHFPSSPAVFTCHGWASAKNRPPSHPRIRRFVPVDQTCRDRLLYEHAVPPELIEVQYNFVDMARFAPRPPLPTRPSRAFVFGTKLKPEHLQLITEECERRGVTLHVLGSESIDNPEIILRDYDLVFARGRCALESMAVGAALIVCGREGMGPMATTQNFDELRSLNFGMRALRAPVTREDVVRVVETYDAADAMAVSRRLRAQASLDGAVTEMLATYTAVIDEHRATVYDRREEDLAIARFVAEVEAQAQRDRERTREVRNRLAEVKAQAHRDREQWRSKLEQLQARHGRLKSKLKKTQHELAAVKPGVVRRLQSYLKKSVNPGPSES